MKEINITRKISQGMYVLTTIDGGCIVDAVSQISGGDNPLIAVSVMKKNYTNELLKIKDEALEKIEACTSLKELNDNIEKYNKEKEDIYIR